MVRCVSFSLGLAIFQGPTAQEETPRLTSDTFLAPSEMGFLCKNKRLKRKEEEKG